MNSQYFYSRFNEYEKLTSGDARNNTFSQPWSFLLWPAGPIRGPEDNIG